MDELSEMLSTLRADATVTGHFTLRAPWAFARQAVSGVAFRICRGAPCYLRVEGQGIIELQSGDIAILPQGSAHCMGSALNTEPVAFHDILLTQGIKSNGSNPLAFATGGDGEICELHTAIVGFHARERHPLLSMLPTLIHIRTSDDAIAPWLRSTLQAFIQESMACEPGWSIVAARLCDVLMAQVVRAFIWHNPDAGPNLIRGLSDAHIAKVLIAVRHAPGASWRVERLAEIANMSRTRFLSRFTELVGMSPMTYVTSVRMSCAAQALTDRQSRVGAIADQVGYASEKAFSRAFHRWFGYAPSSHAHRRNSLPPTRHQ